METHAEARARVATPPLTVLEVEALRRDQPHVGNALDAYELQLQQACDRQVALEDQVQRLNAELDECYAALAEQRRRHQDQQRVGQLQLGGMVDLHGRH